MKVYRKSLAIASLACAILLGANANAAPGDNQAPRYPQAQPYGQQQLSPEQQAKAQAIYDETMASTNSARQALSMKRNQLDQELQSPNPDRGQIEQLSREIGELRGQLLAARAEARSRLSQQGLPPDCFGGCYGMRGMGMMNGWDGYFHHGRGHGRGHGHGGHRGGWDGYYRGMGMMGGW